MSQFPVDFESMPTYADQYRSKNIGHSLIIIAQDSFQYFRVPEDTAMMMVS